MNANLELELRLVVFFTVRGRNCDWWTYWRPDTRGTWHLFIGRLGPKNTRKLRSSKLTLITVRFTERRARSTRTNSGQDFTEHAPRWHSVEGGLAQSSYRPTTTGSGHHGARPRVVVLARPVILFMQQISLDARKTPPAAV